MQAQKARKVELASVSGRRGSQSEQTDAGFPLRRFLENLPPPGHPWAAASEAGDILTIDGL